MRVFGKTVRICWATSDKVEFSRVSPRLDRKSTRLNSSHLVISYAVFCLKKKKIQQEASSSQPIVIRFWVHRQYITSFHSPRGLETTPASFSAPPLLIRSLPLLPA